MSYALVYRILRCPKQGWSMDFEAKFYAFISFKIRAQVYNF